MALVKTVQMVNDTEAIVKIAGIGATGAETSTISLSADILTSTQIVSGTPNVTIIGFQWAGEPGAIYKINRGGVRVASLLADNGNFMDFIELFPSENTNATSNIDVQISTAAGAAIQGEVWLRLRKVSGYANKIETGLYSVYDDLTQVGS